MEIQLKGIKVYYEKKGKKGRDVFLFHGWGQNTQMMAFIADYLSAHFTVYNFDFPGFGKSQDPDRPYSVEDYSELIREFCLKKKIDKPIIIGHSFGCRVALHYAYKYGTYKMVLTGAAGIKDQHSLVWYLKTYSYKLAKKLFPALAKQYANKLGSSDYQNVSGVMRQTFVKVVNDDVTSFLKDIKAETLLVFGEKDTATPVSKGKMMEKLMPNASLVIFENDDHYAYINEARRFLLVLDAFLRSDYE